MSDARTIRAALVAFALTFAGFAGIGIFLGFAAGPAVVAGVVLGVLCALMILAVARRAEGMTGAGGVASSGNDEETDRG